MSQPPVDAIRDAISRADRTEPVGAATIAVLEAAVQLIDADQADLADRPEQRTILLREALYSVRAAAVAAGFAVARVS